MVRNLIKTVNSQTQEIQQNPRIRNMKKTIYQSYQGDAIKKR